MVAYGPSHTPYPALHWLIGITSVYIYMNLRSKLVRALHRWNCRATGSIPAMQSQMAYIVAIFCLLFIEFLTYW
jgi:hypothetical protein